MRPTIVCGIDHSNHARAAVRLTFALAERLRLHPVLLRAVSTYAAPLPAVAPHGPPRSRGELALAAREADEELLGEILAEAGDAEAHVRLDVGRPAARLVTAAEEEDAVLLVVGTQGDGAGRAALLGSVALDVVRSAPCPVVVVPPWAAVADKAPLAGETVLCGVGRVEDRRCAEVAAGLARDLDVGLTLAHVLARDDRPTRAGVGGNRWHEWRRAAARDVLRGVARGMPGRLDLQIRTGEPAEELEALAVEQHAAMIVVGTRGYGALRSGLIGSVSRRLARHGSRPVAVCGTRAVGED